MDKEKKNLLVFGYGLAAILLFICWRIWQKHGWLPICGILLAVSLGMIFIARFNTALLKKIYTKWMVGAHFIGGIVTRIIFSVLFYTVFGAVGIVLRILRKDLLSQRIDKAKNSYWIKKKETIFDKNRYQQQF